RGASSSGGSKYRSEVSLRTGLLPAALLAAAALLCAPRACAQEEAPEAARAHVEEAERLAAAGRAEDAAKSWRLAIAAAPGWIPAYISLGALVAEKKPEEALAVFEQGLAKAPKDETLLFDAAATSLQLSRLPAALAYADRARAETPKAARVHLLRAAILKRLDRKEDALAAFQEAARLEPRSAQAQLGLGNLLYELKRNEEAVQAFRAALERDPSLQRAQYNLGTVLFEMGRDEEAIAAYGAALLPIEKELAKGRPVDAVHAQAFANLGSL